MGRLVSTFVFVAYVVLKTYDEPYLLKRKKRREVSIFESDRLCIRNSLPVQGLFAVSGVNKTVTVV